jgi:DNA polymerase (family 10)/putative hydrolase
MENGNLGIPLLAFTEHVRRDLQYDFKQFLVEIEQARSRFNLLILSGCEAKVLPGGQLDIADWVLQEVDYPVFAFHSFPSDLQEYLRSLRVVLSYVYVNTWAHPGLFITRRDLDLADRELKGLLELMKYHEILLEVNRRYNLPPARWLDFAAEAGVEIVRGSDIHSIDELGTRRVKLP